MMKTNQILIESLRIGIFNVYDVNFYYEKLQNYTPTFHPKYTMQEAINLYVKTSLTSTFF